MKNWKKNNNRIVYSLSFKLIWIKLIVVLVEFNQLLEKIISSKMRNQVILSLMKMLTILTQKNITKEIKRNNWNKKTEEEPELLKVKF